MYFEAYEKLKRYAAIYPDKVTDLTKKELDTIIVMEREGNQNGFDYDSYIFDFSDISVHV